MVNGGKWRQLVANGGNWWQMVVFFLMLHRVTAFGLLIQVCIYEKRKGCCTHGEEEEKVFSFPIIQS